LQGFGDDVAFFIDVAQAVRFVKYDKFPGDAFDIGRFGFGELVGTDDGALLVKRVFAGFAQGGVVFVFEDDAIQAEFFLYFLMPLFAQVGRGDDKNAAFALCPVLQDDEAGFLIQNRHLRAQRSTVAQERELMDQHRPAHTLVRPLLVVVPQDFGTEGDL